MLDRFTDFLIIRGCGPHNQLLIFHVQLIDMFRHLEQQLERREKLAGIADEINSDYIIRKISFVQKSI